MYVSSIQYDTNTKILTITHTEDKWKILKAYKILAFLCTNREEKRFEITRPGIDKKRDSEKAAWQEKGYSSRD